MEKDRLRLSLQSLEDLPIPSVVAVRILEVIGQDTADAAELAKVITYDPSLSTKILRLANSAYYGFPRRVASVKQAIVLLGTNTVKSLSLSIAVYEALSPKRHAGGGLDRQQLWLHSVACASAAQFLGMLGNQLAREAGFTAGLLHDVGKLVMDTQFPEFYSQVLERVHSGQSPLLSAEQEVFGTDHAEVGAWLSERWKFPAVLSEPIAHHHNLENASEELEPIVASVAAADSIAHAAAVGLSLDGDIAHEFEVLGPHGLGEESIRMCWRHLVEDRDRLNSFSFM